ncbi:hypothetical protein AAF712_002540 [Marasmius tenuissimus]|uniref:Non-ribosomal peptide synthetase n=1 Tax=Marasmius tenuissimus TaxID=585030 RepID=A0ABR3A8P9_9AGAR
MQPQNLDDAENGVTHPDEQPLLQLPGPSESPNLVAPVKFESDPSFNSTEESKELLPSPPRPAQARPKPQRANHWIRFRLWFHTYRRFYTFIITFNLVSIFLTIAGVWHYPRQYTGAFVLGNLLVAILVRNELFGRLLYLTVNTLFAKWPPLWFRLNCTAFLQHLGGVHLGCGVSGFLWIIVKIVILFEEYTAAHPAVLTMGILTAVTLCISIASAIPWVRNTHHDTFEQYHRFAGWIGLLFTWAFTILSDAWDLERHQWNPDGLSVLKQQDFWFVFAMTIFIIIPWTTVRRVNVEVEIPSSKAVILKFERGMQQGLLTRISRTSVKEYHAFGIISEGIGSGKHYLICGVQGDFTKSLVDNPPTTIWTRELKFAGVSNTSTLYKRGIRVCTGTGLGAALSTCLQNPNWYLIWIGSDQEKTFGPTISGLINDNLEGRVTLWDSKQRGGRPDTMELIQDTYKMWCAEVVFITSNWTGNKEMMEGCKRVGIPAFGTLWDF